MIQLDEIESKYFDLMEELISIEYFENWVYKSEWLETNLTEDEYTELISLNYNTPNSKYEIGKILKERFDIGKFETIKLIKLLDSIIRRDGNEGTALTKMYDLYCRGYYFLSDLGLGIGLSVDVPTTYDVDYYHELNEYQQKEIVESVYPSAKELALDVKNWIINKDVELTGIQDSVFNRWQYVDNRTDEDKQSKVWKETDRIEGISKLIDKVT